MSWACLSASVDDWLLPEAFAPASKRCDSLTVRRFGTLFVAILRLLVCSKAGRERVASKRAGSLGSGLSKAWQLETVVGRLFRRSLPATDLD